MKKRYLLAGLGSLAGAAIAYKLAARAPEVKWQDFADVLPFAENSRFVEVDGVRMHYQEFGEGNAPPVVMIHGYSSSTFTWNNTAPALAEKGFRVFVVDLMGFGFTSKPRWADYTISAQARLIVRLMDRLGIGRATLVGSSYGGAVASFIALDYAERVEKLVLVGAVSNDSVIRSPVVKILAAPTVGAVLTPFLVDSKRYIRFRMRTSLGKPAHHLIDDERVAAMQRPLKAADAHNSLVATLRSWSANRIEQEAARIAQPTLLIWGEEDRVVPIENGRKLHNLLPNSKMIVFRNCGHVPHEEYTLEFVDLVADFAEQKAVQHTAENVQPSTFQI